MTVEKPESMIFDLDGTLFKTETLLLPAFHVSLTQMIQETGYEGPVPEDREVLGTLGMLMDEIWKRLLPGCTPEQIDRMNELLAYHELSGLESGRGVLYEGVAETLTRLQDAGVRLFVASNGLESYVKGVLNMRGISSFFEKIYSAGEYRTKSKVDLVRLLLEENHVQDAFMVGDRSSDVEAGHKNGLTVIGCDFAGFGDPKELEDADIRIKDFRELARLIRI
ncbi:pyrophosphatase PpaX [Paenibacillus larvae subsp. larvae]|uniref:Haloacid dehalogenase n=2 Tax=Paenibacillus larvae TaxID=1464 RepID=A0A1U9YKM3_9BACL|nr:HAD family hydrolase [Paenibacillus larvae]AQT85799.1 haloacid dehalogenase [Paenibacillus larvae subsp. pulvifaciens]AQZ45978.1 haloacid dehalogenase [Paenibacillus larvae subsp. pulvifaciens]ARF69105.1 haloacid dehalogenase [Paenibacillus larvae subsp. pulvifaciens]AVF25204.1 pyrophosphatase PpaX [Paenibacillus larvae subsp. larvae]AVF29981.1 pyrophosphatase PpaX [Paenibacillus larvae subsp. larvae]